MMMIRLMKLTNDGKKVQDSGGANGEAEHYKMTGSKRRRR